jgi:hypothetical protein
MPVIARSASDEAISAENKDCFAALAMTPQFHFTPLPSRMVVAPTKDMTWAYLPAHPALVKGVDQSSLDKKGAARYNGPNQL